ncbi:T9SS type B sorting domain-containing protein [Hanstruepera ponticola]|uniref:T9SS type B sorting domain-containing protein n=1 Tax=Hanstruepera ponticola TaxID=2042995 RepID=UPI000CF11A82|nr:T9SS type B sorting domain-containing protein [Hanstruepera ponticola]
MKKLLFYILFLCFTVTYSQRQASNWYFGENAGIQFDANNNVSVLNDGQLNTIEGCSSISDNDGNLLFYTDGGTVFTSEHNVMRNGMGLLGDESSTQSAIVIPKPNDSNIFYIFTVGSNQTSNGMKYSVVDMSREMGRGEVIIKNENLLSQSAEKIAAVLKDCETGSIWVVGLSDFSGNTSFSIDTFHAFLVSETGVNTTAVRSNFDRLGFSDKRGYLKLSPDGTKMACANVDDGLYLFDFDVSTGLFSYNQRLNIPSTSNQPYGVEFSPNSEVLYATASNDNFGNNSGNPTSHRSVLVQYDLMSANINASVSVIDDRNLFRSALQLGPDGKIYRTMAATYDTGLPFLSTIDNPNQLGLGCNYQHQAISLGSNNSTQGLPPFIASFFTEKIDIINNGLETTVLPLCIGDSYTLTYQNIPGATYSWSLDGNPLSETDNTLDITGPGTYELVIDLNNGDCEFLEGEAIVEYFDYPVANPVSDLSVCDDNNDGTWAFDLSIKNDDILLNQDSTVYSVHYFESFSDAQNNENEITSLYTNTTNPSTIFARIHNNGNINCYQITDFDVEVFSSPTANTIDTQELCDNDDDGDDANGQILIDLQSFNQHVLGTQNPTNYTITYHNSQSFAENGDNSLPLNYYNNIAFQEEIFVRIENNFNEDCFDVTSFNILVNPIPQSFDAELIQCDEDGNVDGFTTFNLNEAFDDLTGSSSAVYVEFYNSINDAENNNGILNASGYNNGSNPEVIYAKVIDNDSDCYSISELRLEVSTTQISDYIAPEVCDELDSEDGINTFDLDAITAAIQADNSLVFPVTYYETYNDALLEQNELLSPYNNTIPYNQTIFSRVENDNACYGIGEVILTVNPLPEMEEDETLLYCLNEFPTPIMIDAGILNDNPSNYSYSWSSGQDTYEIAVNQTGVYTVTSTNVFGCSKSRNITIEPSNVATIESFEVVDGSSNNSITVIVSGEGEYDYALFDENGLFLYWQPENVFTNIPPGIYTVKVRDLKNDCGIVEELVSVIGFPKFFTPNGDGSNDTWNVKGVSGQFQPGTKILIFDRYGKLLKELSPSGQGWDGTFNGTRLPVSDYWFSVKLQDGRVFKSHFTLKR